MDTSMPITDEAMAAGDRMAAHWKFADACEHALDKYRLALTEAGRKDELSDQSVRHTVTRAFFGAAIQEQLDKYMAMAPAEIVSMVAAHDAAMLGPDGEKLRCLYALLREKAYYSDTDAAASLVWAISIIEQQYREL